MPIRNVPNSEATYHLIVHDDQGREVAERDGSMLSRAVLDAIANQPVTDVFVMSHGWRGDVPAAIRQFDNWTANLMAQQADVNQMTRTRPGFRPLLIGLHWPSEPWGDEQVGSFDIASDAVGKLVDEYAVRLGDSPEVRAELQTIVEAYTQEDEPPSLPASVVAAYNRLNGRIGLRAEGTAPGADRPSWDPEDVYQAARQEDTESGSFGLLDTVVGDLLAPLRTLSFWKMKDRARLFGESGGHNLLTAIAALGRPVRVHLMGHSFGCIVVSAMAAGPPGNAANVPLVQSLVLVQGALSLWSYAGGLAAAQRPEGYFARILKEHRVAGPIVTTQSEFDTAVGRAYPIAAGLRHQVAFGDFPKYGAVGTFGLQGLDSAVVSGRRLAGSNEDYRFESNRVYNLESSDIIRQMSGAAGAHNDIAHPQVAHLIWQAAQASGAGLSRGSGES